MSTRVLVWGEAGVGVVAGSVPPSIPKSQSVTARIRAVKLSSAPGSSAAVKPAVPSISSKRHIMAALVPRSTPNTVAAVSHSSSFRQAMVTKMLANIILSCSLPSTVASIASRRSIFSKPVRMHAEVSMLRGAGSWTNPLSNRRRMISSWRQPRIAFNSSGVDSSVP